MHGQAPQPQAAPTTGLLESLQHLGWVDVSALTVLGVFFVIGLFKGFLWQVSRVAILVAAYAGASQLGQPLARVLLQWTHDPATPVTAEQQETSLYIACVLIFLGILIALSLLALLLQNLVKRAGMTFFDRLGGGMVGLGTGSVVVLFLMLLLFMFFPRSHVAAAARDSFSVGFSRWAVQALGGVVPPELQKVFTPDATARTGGKGKAGRQGVPAGAPPAATGQGGVPASGPPVRTVPLLPSVQPGGGTATPAPAAPAGPTRLRPPSRGVPAGYGQDPAAEPGAPDRAAPSDPGVRNAEPAPKPPNTPPTTPRTGGA